MALIRCDSSKEWMRFVNDFLDWFYSEWDDAVRFACNDLQEVLNDAAILAIEAYYDTWVPRMYKPRTYQLPFAYNIVVKPDSSCDQYYILNLDKVDISNMASYHSIYGDKRSLDSGEMESVVGYILKDGGRPIPPHIKNSPYDPSYGPISINIPELYNVEVFGNSVAEIVMSFDNLDDELEEYMSRLVAKALQPGLVRFIRSWK